MVSPDPGHPSDNHQALVSAPANALGESARTTGQALRVFGFQVIAFLLGIALAFM